jgi:hypothetical protein
MSADCFARIEKEYGFPSGLMDSMWLQESTRGTDWVSSANARGHFQFMPRTRDEVMAKTGKDPWSHDPVIAAECAAFYLNQQLKRFDGDLAKALAAYNAGGRRVERISEKYGLGWLSKLSAETRNYVPSILERVGFNDRLAFTNRYQHRETDEAENQAERTQRRALLRDVFRMSQDDVDKMGDSALLGTSFLAIAWKFIKDALSALSNVLEPQREPVIAASAVPTRGAHRSQLSPA